MFRARASGFFVGFGVAGVLAAYQIRQDILKSHEVLAQQADKYRQGLEKRVASLEATVGQLQAAAVAAEVQAAAAASAPAPSES
ncbi:hypothetical protein PLESTF_001270800 [Pleodorina starrii]|nr:hypothetical protein PLESTF_001270800 [Pleodorina starrii]